MTDLVKSAGGGLANADLASMLASALSSVGIDPAEEERKAREREEQQARTGSSMYPQPVYKSLLKDAEGNSNPSLRVAPSLWECKGDLTFPMPSLERGAPLTDYAGFGKNDLIVAVHGVPVYYEYGAGLDGEFNPERNVNDTYCQVVGHKDEEGRLVRRLPADIYASGVFDWNRATTKGAKSTINHTRISPRVAAGQPVGCRKVGDELVTMACADCVAANLAVDPSSWDSEKHYWKKTCKPYGYLYLYITHVVIKRGSKPEEVMALEDLKLAEGGQQTPLIMVYKLTKTSLSNSQPCKDSEERTTGFSYLEYEARKDAAGDDPLLSQLKFKIIELRAMVGDKGTYASFSLVPISNPNEYFIEVSKATQMWAALSKALPEPVLGEITGVPLDPAGRPVFKAESEAMEFYTNEAPAATLTVASTSVEPSAAVDSPYGDDDWN